MHEEYMEPFTQLVNESIASCVTYFATHADTEARRQYVTVLVQVLHQPIDHVLKDIHTIASTLMMVSEDSEKSVRESLVMRIPDVYVRCIKLHCQDLDYFLYDRMLDIVLLFLKDPEPEVSSKACISIMILLQKYLLNKNRIEEKVCPAIVELSETLVQDAAQQMEYQTNAIELMKLLAPIIGPQKTQEFFIDRIIALASHHMFYVRKCVAEFIPVFCQVMGQEFTESTLLPVYVGLCSDDRWAVRKMAAIALLRVALNVSVEHRRTQLSPIMYRFMNDPSRWVSVVAFETLGQFISLFAQPCITGLSYTDTGEMFITNAANKDFKLQCDIQLLANYAQYEAIFERTLTPPNATVTTPTVAAKYAGSGYQQNVFFSQTVCNTPYYSFVEIDNDRPIDDTSDALERFYREIEAPPPPPDEFDDIVLPNIHTTPSVASTPPVVSVALLNNNTINNDDELLPFAVATDASTKNVSGRKVNHSKSKKKAKNKAANNRPCLVYQNGIFMDPSMVNEDMKDWDEGWDAPVNNANPTDAVEIANEDLTTTATTTTTTTATTTTTTINTNTPVVPQDDNNSNPIVTSSSTEETAKAVLTTNTTTTTTTCPLRKNAPDGLPLIIKQAIEIKEVSPLLKKKIQRQKAGIGLNINLANELAPETPLIEAAPVSIDFTTALLATTASVTTTASTTTTTTTTTINHNTDSDTDESVAKILDKVMSFDQGQQDQKAANIKKLLIDDEPESDFNRAVNALQYDEPVAMDLDDHRPPPANDPDEVPTLIGTDEPSQRRSTLPIKLHAQMDDSDENNELPEFNSANFWYITPSIPMDLDILAKINNNNVDANVTGDFEMSSSDRHTHQEQQQQQQLIHVSPHDDENAWEKDNRKTAEESIADDMWRKNITRLQESISIESTRPFNQEIVPGYILRYFVSMVQLNDSVLNLHCVYNFPAVALTLGERYWHLLRGLLRTLCDDIHWKIRKTVAVFIYQIGLIIGRAKATKDLLPIFMGFFKDLDEVKIEALRNLTDFLQIIDVEHHHKIIFRLGCCLKADNYSNWRFREELAQQVLNLIRKYGIIYNSDCVIYLTGIALILLTDEVCTVREIALEALVEKFKLADPADAADMIQMLLGFYSQDPFWRKRQIFVQLCHKLVAAQAIDYKIFEMEMLGQVIKLAKDTVPNVRLNVAKLLASVLMTNDYFANGTSAPLIRSTIELLNADTDSDVRYMSQYPQTDVESSY